MKYYITHFTCITQYDITNKGYYVKYKDKLQDEYSDNWMEAKRYKTLKPALTRLSYIFPDNYEYVLSKFDKYENSNYVQRERKLNRVFGKDGGEINIDAVDIFDGKGFIEVVDVTKNGIKNLGKIDNRIIYEHYKKLERKNQMKYDAWKKKNDVEIIEHEPGDINDEFWS